VSSTASAYVPTRARFLPSDRVILGAVMEAPRDTSASTELLIRSGTEDDSRGVLRLWRDAETAPSATDDPEGLYVLLAADPGALLVAESEGLIVGALIAERGHTPDANGTEARHGPCPPVSATDGVLRSAIQNRLPFSCFLSPWPRRKGLDRHNMDTCRRVVDRRPGLDS
jgi:hypothetical protein